MALPTAAVCAAVATVLLLHHGWKHALEDPATSVAQRESCAWVCYFQMSDVGNIKTWNHETFIVGFAALAVGLTLAAWVSVGVVL